MSLDEDTDQVALSAVANRLNELLDNLTAAQAQRALAALDPSDPGLELPRRVGERVVRALYEFDGTAIEELFSDGLLNVMAAPEFAAEREAPPGLRGPREPDLPGRADRRRRRIRAGPRVHRP